MLSWEEPWARASISHLNTELSHAELELSCVEFSLRGLLRLFSVEQIGRYARPDLVSNPLNKLQALQNFYCTVNNFKGSPAPPRQIKGQSI
jgi:hypothetical protein